VISLKSVAVLLGLGVLFDLNVVCDVLTLSAHHLQVIIW
jgi:hypothetical protein